MKLALDLIAIICYGLAEIFDRIAAACESESPTVYHETTTNGH